MEITQALIDKAKTIREWHPLCELFPLMSEDEFHELATSVKEHGLRMPILTLGKDGPVADGRNRLLACAATDTDPTFRTIDEDQDEASLIWNLNYQRRHLTPSQASMAVAKYREYIVSKGVTEDPEPITNVPLRTTERALSVLRKAPEEVVRAVQNGIIKVGDAAKQLDLSKPKQKALIKSVLSGDHGTMQQARQADSRAGKKIRQVSQSSEEWLLGVVSPYEAALQDLKEHRSQFEEISKDPQLGVHLPWTRIRVDFESAYGSLYHNKPAAVCCGPDAKENCKWCKGAGFVTHYTLSNLTPEQIQEWEDNR